MFQLTTNIHRQVQTLGFRIANYDNIDLYLEKNRVVKLPNILTTKLPASKKGREWFEYLAGKLSLAMTDIMMKSTSRAVQMNEDMGALAAYEGLNLPTNADELPKDEVKALMKRVLDDQKERGLLTHDEKSAVREPATGSSVNLTGTSCAQCNVDGITGSNLKLMRCGGCQSVWYCCVECQKEHWPKHKKFCKARRAGKI